MKLFISYVREDMESAQRLCNDLVRAGIEVWFDKDSLLPGVEWWPEIVRGIKESTHVIALLSTRAVSKKGVMQKEVRRALEVLEEFPEGSIFLIPARLDNCRPTYTRLHEIHWVDLFPSWESGVTQILRAVGYDERDSPPNLKEASYQELKQELDERNKYFTYMGSGCYPNDGRIASFAPIIPRHGKGIRRPK
ncbi:MAG: toll/interleukin-1 receptor domain-containing protein [Nitrospinae bacterium]|nr:toll/interleukin-1 receptor domain-containing protein [Nitrospinota bacterium]